MARRQKRGGKNTWIWYAVYAVAGYYGYGWYKQYQMKQSISTPTVAPQGTITQ